MIELWQECETDGILEFVNLCEEAFREVQGKKEIPRWLWNKYWLIKNKDILKKEIVVRLKELFYEREYPEEEIRGYRTEKTINSKPIWEQIEIVSDLFHLPKQEALRYSKNLPALPDGADCFYAIPSSGHMFPKEKTFLAQYIKAIKSSISSLKIGHSEDIKLEELKVDPVAETLIHKLEQEQGAIFIVPIGHRHEGRSLRRAKQFFLTNELPIWLLAGISATKTDPEWFDSKGSIFSAKRIICGEEGIYPGNPCIANINHGKRKPEKPWINVISPDRQADSSSYCVTAFNI